MNGKGGISGQPLPGAPKYPSIGVIQVRVETGSPLSRAFPRGALQPSAALGLATMLLSVAPGAHAQAAPDKASFTRCSICHSVNGTGGKLGPDLAGIVGRKAGTLGGYSYSPAMKKSAITWTPETLRVFLTGPQKMVPGTKMAFSGLSDAAQRDKIIAYLKSSARK